MYSAIFKDLHVYVQSYIDMHLSHNHLQTQNKIMSRHKPKRPGPEWDATPCSPSIWMEWQCDLVKCLPQVHNAMILVRN